MSEIERLASIAEAHVRPNMCKPEYPGAARLQGLGFTGGVEAVRAILRAIREPSEGQYEALSATGTLWRDLDSATVWRTYIDALLNDKEPVSAHARG